MTARASTGTKLALGLLVAASFSLRAWYGAAEPSSSRFYDERFSFHNVTAFLVHDRWVPANAYYPSLSFLPQAGVLWASETLSELTGAEALSVYGGTGERWSPIAYLLARWLSALWGTLSIYWTYRIGRRLFSPAAGLAAAVVLSVVPHHLFSSAMFKPDILVVWLVLVAFEAAVGAVERPSPRRFAWAGAAVGLAVAAKYTGVGAAIPLTVGALAGCWASGRRWLLLVLAGAVSVGAFLLLNPWIGATVAYLPELAEIYQRKGGEAGGSRLGMMGAEIGFLWRHHGPLVAPFLLGGLAALVPSAWRQATGRAEGRGVLMVFSWIVGWSLVYAAATTLFKGQNYLPVVPFTSLVAGWAAVALGERIERRRPLPRLAWGLLAAVVAVALAAPSVTRIYREVVPTTVARAAEVLVPRLQPIDRRLVVYESPDEPLWVRAGGARSAMVPVASLPEIEPEALAGADAVVFPASRLTGPRGEEYARLLARGRGEEVLRIAPETFAARGAEMVVLVAPWQAAGAEPLSFAPAEGAMGYRISFPPAAAPRRVSLALELPMPREGRPVVQARVGGRELPLYLTQGRGRRGRYLSPRFTLPAGAGRLPVELPGLPPGPGGPGGELLVWTPGGVHSRR